MALKVQASFSAGELDPALHERTTFDKYQSGLKTGRNVIVGKTGRVISRMGRQQFKAAKALSKECLLYSPPNSGYLIEWGHLYVRVYDFNGNLIGSEQSHALTETNNRTVKFKSSGVYVYIFCSGQTVLKFNFTTSAFITSSLIFKVPANPTSTVVVDAGTGYDVEYLVTEINNNQEGGATLVGTAAKLPINPTEYVRLTVTVATTGGTPVGIRVYRRPKNGGSFGFIGSSTYTADAGVTFVFEDKGQAADYTHERPINLGLLPTLVLPISLLSKTGCFYQQRLLLTDNSSGGDDQAIFASRPGYTNNFLRDFPLSSDSALLFKSGTSGQATVIDMIESDGLVVFTTVGIFLHIGELSPTNLGLARKGKWIINSSVPPITIPGGTLFIDSSTNTIRELAFSLDAGTYQGSELSSFSNHLFTSRQVVSWAFHEGDTPLLWVVFDDGKHASFTFEPDQQMRAWTRHDSTDINIEAVAGTGFADKTFFLVEKDGVRNIELTVPRYISGATLEADPEALMGHSIAAMDSMVSFETLLNDSLVGASTFILTPLVADEWDGELTLTCGTSALFTVLTYGAIGTIFRFFSTVDGSSVDLEVTARASNNSVTVQPSCTFPSDEASGFRLYKTTNELVSGLGHLEGEYPSVIVDGYVVCSPNNNDQNYPAVQVIGGHLILPNEMRGAIIHVGRSFTADVETLDIDTVEQRPTLIESKTTNKLYLKTYNSRGLYIANKFPANDKVEGMMDVDSIEVDGDAEDDESILANRFQPPTTKRVEMTIPGDWNSQGRVCIRQVDPLHFEILSIIPDLEDLRR